MRSDSSKENIHPNKINSSRHSRKYSYSESIPTTPASLIENHSKYDLHENEQRAYIEQLEYELAQQRQKCKWIEQKTLQEQEKWLQQIGFIQSKFIQAENERKEMKQLLEESCQQINQFKKVKGVAEAMVKMMEKVEKKSGDYHQAWRWIKKMIREYESLRKKGLEWKQAYDNMKHKQHKRNDTFNNSSDQSSDLNQL